MATAVKEEISPEEAASDMPNLGGYWQKQLLKLEDMCRQCGKGGTYI